MLTERWNPRPSTKQVLKPYRIFQFFFKFKFIGFEPVDPCATIPSEKIIEK